MGMVAAEFLYQALASVAASVVLLTIAAGLAHLWMSGECGFEKSVRRPVDGGG